MSYRKWREEFLVRFSRLVPQGTRADAEALLRAATGSQRYNEITCSIDVGEAELARLERREENRTKRVRDLCAKLGVKLDENGDPRGDPYCLLVGEREYRLSVPGNGLPARCFQ